MSYMGNKPKKTSLTKQCIDWLHNQGCFAEQVYTRGTVFILALKGGRVLCVCTANQVGTHDAGNVFADLVLLGGVDNTICVKDLNELKKYCESNIFL